MIDLARRREDLTIPVPGGELRGDLVVPLGARGIVAFAHGSGSSRRSPRNRAVAEVLEERHLATFLADLLTPEEAERDEITAELRFDIPLISERMTAIVDALTADPRTRGLPLGLFGASTGAAAALVAAAARPDAVRAVVSRGGRADLAVDALPRVRAATLLIVGERDFEVLALNREALREIRAEVRHLTVVPGATHLFEEAGAMARVIELAASWFEAWLRTEIGLSA